MRHAMKHATKHVISLALAAVLLVALTGCESGSDGDSSRRLASTSGGTFCNAVQAYTSLAKSGAVGVNIDSSMSDEEIDRRMAEGKQRMREQVTEGREILDDIKSKAPSEIRADVRLVIDTEIEYLDALEDNGYDPFSLLTDPRFSPRSAAADAARRVNTYTEQACGIALKPNIDEIGTVTSTVEEPGPVGTPGTPGTVPMPPPPPAPPPYGG